MSVTVLRVDADRESGFGHLERAMALARELVGINYRPVFVTRKSGLAASRLKERGFTDVVTFTETEDEAEAVLSAEPGIVVFDIGATSHDLVAAVKNVGCFAVTFEDLGDGRYLSDLVVDANLTEATHQKKMETPTRYLLGPDYAVLSPEVLAARKKRRVARGVRRIIVSCGGSDPAGVTPGVVTGLSMLDTEIEIEIVLGPAFAHPKRLNEALLASPRTFTIVESPDDLPLRLRAADLGILSGGTTLFEAAYLGLPALVIAQHSTQLKNLPPFERRGGIVSLGLAANDPYGNLRAAIRQIQNEDKLAAMSAAQEGYVDGKGLQRLISAMRTMVGR